jgi:hypothetical protein
MSGSNGNGRHRPDKPEAVEQTALEEVVTLIEERRAEEVAEGEPPLSDDNDEHPSGKWKKAEPLTLDVVREGLITVSKYAEAAIEGGIRMAADLNKALPTIERTEVQARIIASKLETTSSHVHQVDNDVAKLSRTMTAVRKDVQFIKDTVSDMAEPVRQIPAIKELLGDILARLPEPRKRRKAS